MARPGLIRGATRLLEALRLLRREPGLWIWCLLPLALNLLLFGAAIAVFAANYDALVLWLESLLAMDDPRAWYQWLWVGPIRALAWLLRWVLIAAVALLVYLLFTVVGSVLASPFLDLLSERVERIVAGAAPAAPSSWRTSLRVAARVFVEDLKRTAFFVLVQGALLAVALVPLLTPVAGIASLLFTMLFLSLDYTAYSLDRRRVPFHARRLWLWQHRRAMLGFGGAAFASFLVPGLNFLCLPVLVTGGTLLALEAGVPEAG